jgi:hypothetical protein
MKSCINNKGHCEYETVRLGKNAENTVRNSLGWADQDAT